MSFMRNRDRFTSSEVLCCLFMRKQFFNVLIMTIVYELTSVSIKFSFLFNQNNYIDHISIEYKLENKI